MLVTMLVSHAGDDADGATWPQHDEDVESCWQRCYRVMLATAWSGRLGRDAMEKSSHAGECAIEFTLPQLDLDVALCWR
jgi:hypothetical protein